MKKTSLKITDQYRFGLVFQITGKTYGEKTD